MNLLIIGLRGSGKTTAGRLAAQRLSLPFVDLDDLTPVVLGHRTVRSAWDACGQDAFRRAETVALASAVTRDQRVIALGGGTPTAPLAADLIEHERAQGRARVVYLWAPASVLRARLASSLGDRPSLDGGPDLVEGFGVEGLLLRGEALAARALRGGAAQEGQGQGGQEDDGARGCGGVVVHGGDHAG
ncbi:hypothetical protein J4558_18510 [Leptolyngbya sp. 15MV]|nr:hypothetical protein J4558_18510 [Leptolyngbya sp. 15MV]